MRRITARNGELIRLFIPRNGPGKHNKIQALP